MKVLVIAQHFWPENFRINDLVQNFNARGYQVTVLTGLPNYPAGKFFSGYGISGPWVEWLGGIKVIRVPVVSRGASGIGRLILNHLSFLVCGFFGMFFRMRGNFDLIFIFGSSPIAGGILGVFAGWNSRAPIMFWVLDLWPDSLSAVLGLRSKLILTVLRKVMQIIYRRCDCILAQGKGFIGKIENMGINKNCIKYFPNWVEENYIQNDNSICNIFIPEINKFKIMFAGNIGAAQDFDSILIAMEYLKKENVQWIFVGEGRFLPWLIREVHVRGLNELVCFLGQQDHSKMPYLLKLADALLVSLKAEPIFTVTVPGKVQSYLASGRPILAMLRGEGAEIIKESQAGLVCDSGDAKALSDNILKMMSLSLQEREKLGCNGRQYALENFNRQILLDHVNDCMIEFYNNNNQHHATFLP